MFNLINSIFCEKGFKTFGQDDCKIEDLHGISYFFAANQTGKKEYYIVILLSDINVKQLYHLIKGDFFSRCFNSIKSSKNIYEKEVDKNSSMLICYEVSSNNVENKELLQRVIYEIEEDPYFFKKNVLSYSTEQVNAIKKIIDEQQIILSLEKQLSNIDNFRKFKANPAAVVDYEFLTKLFIKLPFLNLTNIELGKLKNLKSKIVDELKNKNLTLDHKLITHLAELELDTFEIDELDDLILKME